jgi:hypothetical protein
MILAPAVDAPRRNLRPRAKPIHRLGRRHGRYDPQDRRRARDSEKVTANRDAVGGRISSFAPIPPAHGMDRCRAGGEASRDQGTLLDPVCRERVGDRLQGTRREPRQPRQAAKVSPRPAPHARRHEAPARRSGHMSPTQGTKPDSGRTRHRAEIPRGEAPQRIGRPPPQVGRHAAVPRPQPCRRITA